jgi:glycosyltransferase involved in cell wall biosynthesis
MKKTLAIFSPSKNAYSETFIQAHKKLNFNVKYYYDGFLPAKLEGMENLFIFNFLQKLTIRLRKNFNLTEHALINSLKKERVDCVLAEYGTSAVATLKVVSYLKLPLVVHFHGSDASIKQVLKSNEESYKMVFAYASKIIVVSEKMKSVLLGLGCPENKLILSYYGPNEKFLDCNPNFHSQSFVAVGRFVEKKAPHLTILSFRKIAHDFPSSRLIMIGEGELLPICQQLVHALNLSEQVEFKMIQTPDQIENIFDDSIAFVQHSIEASNGDSEGTPVAVLEAQAAALPVISTLHGGIPDVVVNGETGLLTDEKNVEGMARNMHRILDEKGLAKKLGEAGRKRVKKYFTQKKHLQQVEKAINSSILL